MLLELVSESIPSRVFAKLIEARMVNFLTLFVLKIRINQASFCRYVVRRDVLVFHSF